jgi:ABC-type transport system involved in cytochrome bd biosynthesis fused ATPase/permease subunit
LPVAALALGLPLVVAVTLPPALVWRAGADEADTELSGEISAHVVDLIHGAPDLLAFGADGAALTRLEEMSTAAETLARRRDRAGALATGITQLSMGAAAVAVLAVSVTAVHAGHLNPVMVAVLPLAALGTFEPIPGVTMAVARARAVRAAARRLLALETVPVPVTDPAQPRTLPEGVPQVSFDRATLRYSPDLPPALDGVTLDVTPGGRVAVTGSSGAGKSSLVNALLRFWPLESGSLRLGEIDADALAQSDARGACALVDQRAQLFAGTLRSNVTLGRPDATNEEINAVLQAAQLAPWVAALPAGLDTPIGEDGVAISGGERRRLAVARALLAGGPLLLLDEPSAGLDPLQGDQLIDDVFAAAGERSVLLITHRAAEAQRCTSVIVLEAGRTVP